MNGGVSFVDLSAPIQTDSPDLAPHQRTEIEFQDHAAGAQAIEDLLGVSADHLRDGEGWAVETFIQFGTHNSTHVDAPWHYNSHIGGEPAKTIDELPLEWFFAPGVKLDFRGKADGDAIDVADVRAELDRVGHPLRPRDIVLMQTGRDASYGTVDYIRQGPGVSAAATRWLYDEGVRVMGIDAWGWDRPLHEEAEDVAAGRAARFWEAHQVDLEYSQIERLVNLDQLPATGFRVACFPLRIVGGSAAPARVVALVGAG